MRLGERAWVDVVKVAVAVALVAMVVNVSLPGEMAGGLQEWSVVRKTVAKVASSGTVWAALSVVAGWRCGRVGPALVAGVVAPLLALTVHYGAMIALGLGDASLWSSNFYWYLAAIVLGGPLGLCGWLASRNGRLGVLGRLVVPLGAIAEPLLLKAFVHPFPEIPWPERYSDTAAGVCLVGLGLAGVVLVCRRALVAPASAA